MNGNGNLRLIWDWNGTLLDDVPACIDAINVMLSRRRLSTIDLPRYRDAFDFPVRRYYERLGFDIEGEDWDSICVEYHGLYAVHSRDSGLRSGSLAALEKFRTREFPMFLLSACEAMLLRSMVEARELEGYFREIYGLQNLHAHSKADAGRAMMSATGSHPSATWLIGDTTHDYEVATTLGCHCVLMSGGHQSVSRLRACDCPLVTGMAELADHIEREADGGS